MQDADAQMRRRAELVEPPFGTLKCRAGYRHFLVRGFNKVRGEWGLMALCYNFSRVLSILGIDSFMAHLAKRYPDWAILPLNIAAVVFSGLQALAQLLKAQNQPKCHSAWKYAC